jgi:hypothetical protein
METIRYSLIGAQDIKTGFGSFEVTLADGRTVILEGVNSSHLIPAYASASVLPTVGVAGRIARDQTTAQPHVVLGAGALHWDNGALWEQILTGHHARMASNSPIIPAPNGGLNIQNGLWRESIVRAWISCNYAGSTNDSLNVSSITDNGTGDTTITWDRDFANDDYVVLGLTRVGAGAGLWLVQNIEKAVGSARFETRIPATGALSDALELMILAVGQQ